MSDHEEHLKSFVDAGGNEWWRAKAVRYFGSEGAALDAVKKHVADHVAMWKRYQKEAR